MQLGQETVFLEPLRALLVPVRRLDAQEHAGHEQYELDDDRRPVLLPQRLRQAAQDHGAAFAGGQANGSGIGGARCTFSRSSARISDGNGVGSKWR